MAKSGAIREEFERLRAASRFPTDQPVDLDRLIDFLTTMNRFGPPPQPRPFLRYTRVLL